jgi:threonine/homoserine/homoserine lactone efflux protein
MVRDAFTGRAQLPKPGANAKVLSNGQLLALGVGATLVNPFWYAWWLTVGATYLSYPAVRAYGLLSLLVFYLGHIAGDYLWDSILSGVVGGGRKWLTDGIYKWIIAACGAYLIYLGGVFIVTALQALA